MQSNLTETAYSSLLSDISEIYLNTKQETEKAANRLRVKAYWEIGRRIVAVEQSNKLRATYGDRLLENLSQDLTTKHGNGFSVRNLRNMRQFYAKYRIRQTSAELPWSHYQVLSTVKNDDDRKEFERQAVRNSWSARDLTSHLKQKNVEREILPDIPAYREDEPPMVEPVRLTTKRGKLNTYRLAQLNCIHERKGSVLLDLGFNVFHWLEAENLPNLQPGHFVESKAGAVTEVKANKDDIYTYVAYVESVIDGDTIWAQIDLGFNNYIRQKLRFRGIDTPELVTPKGQHAKRFVQDQLKSCQFIIIKTYKSDKYDRYLSDIFYKHGTSKENKALTEGQFLNQELLEQGLAIQA